MVNDEVFRKVDEELAKRCKSWKYLLLIFLLVTTPGLYNALHITVYVFITSPPQYACNIDQLVQANWTFQQILNISSGGGSSETCSMYKWNYRELADMGYDAALELTQLTHVKPETEPCSSYVYSSQEISSVIQQWDLVCDRSYLTSMVQVAVAFGKFVGAFCFGIVADKFGRKRCFLLASILYVVSGPLAAWAESFTLFLILRFCLGLAGSAVYETGYVLLTELTVNKWRSRMSCVFGIFYPVGMILLPIIAINFKWWRLIQLFISLPTFFILLNCWFLPESPRWLLLKGRSKEAWEILVGKERSQAIELSLHQNGSAEVMLKKQDNTKFQEKKDEESHIWYKKCLVFMREVFQIFTNSELRSRAIICNFSWFIASLCYYAIALNGVNLTSNLYLYIALNGLFEAPGYMLPVFLISYFGRRSSSIMSFFITGISLLVIMAIPAGLEWFRMVWAMIGRLWVSSVFSFITLHTSELFPTSNRNTAIGMTLTMSQIGSMSAPLLVQAGQFGWYIPSTVCGCLAILAGLFVLLLPETRDTPLSDTMYDVEKSKKVSWTNCCSFKS